ncbi:MAG TPA: hypothetical protein VE035_06655 [Puia sp.]|nr:hypothetical protein [Puia sp.]
MSLKIFISIVVIITLAALAYYLKYSWDLTKGDMERFLKVAGVGTAALLSIVGIICNLFSAFSIEDVKKKNQEEIEKLKTSLGIGLEFSKIKMAAERTGYTDLNQAVQNYYHELAKMEQKIFDKDKIALAETKMADAGKHLFLLQDDSKKLYFNVWQICRNLYDQGLTITNSKYDELWKTQAKDLGNLTIKFETIIKQKLTEAPTV